MTDNIAGKIVDATQRLILGASTLVSSASAVAFARQAQAPYVRVAQIEIDPPQLESYRAAVKDVIETSVRVEPGVLALCSVSYKAATQDMVKSLKLMDTVPISLSAKGK